MQAFSLFILLAFLSLSLSALINYPLYLLLQESFVSRPEKLINTTAKLIAIPGFIWIIRYYAINSKQGLGYGLPRPEFMRELLRGLLVGSAILIVLALALQILGVRVMKSSVDDILYVVVRAALSGIVSGLLIGFIEETFFRGGLFGAIRKHNGFLLTMLLSSLLYAALHFIKPEELPPGEAHQWFGGLTMLYGAFSVYTEWKTFDSFLALFVLGAMFALIRERTGNIAYCIGLHAGFVFIIKIVRKMTRENDDSSLSLLVGDYNGIIGYLSAVVILIYTLILYKRWRRPELQ